MKLLVTGGSGLVGSAIKKIHKKFKYDFIFLSSKDCDLSNYEETKLLFEKHKPDYVIHLASSVGGLFKNLKSNVQMLEKNMMINFNVVKCCHDYKVKKLISCLSTCVFPDKTKYPINENMLHNGSPHNSNFGYAYSKRILDIHSKSYREQYNDNFFSIIPTNIYGENDNFSLEDGHVIPALIHKCYLAKKNNEDFIIRGSGKALRQFIYSIDLAELIMWTLQYYNESENIILSVNETDEVSIEHVARSIAKNFNYDHKLKFDINYSDGQFKKTADNSKLINLIRKFNFTSIDEGIKKTIDWFVNNYENCRK